MACVCFGVCVWGGGSGIFPTSQRLIPITLGVVMMTGHTPIPANMREGRGLLMMMMMGMGMAVCRPRRACVCQTGGSVALAEQLPVSSSSASAGRVFV